MTITLALLMSSMGTISVFAEKPAESTSKNGSVNIQVTIQERNGIYVKDFFVRRGIALEEGLVYDAEEICVTENGNIIPSAAEATEPAAVPVTTPTVSEARETEPPLVAA